MTRYLITGGTGSLGTVLCRKWHAEGHSLTVISRDIHKQEALRRELPGVSFYSLDLGNRENLSTLARVCVDKDVCIHAAAQKIVDQGEYQPGAYVTTNVKGTVNLLDAWSMIHGHCRALLAISSDKAVQAINLYGASKKVMESLVRMEEHDGSVLRYGNVVTSNGSFLHKWRRQIEEGQPLTVRLGQPADESPTRFFLSMDQAVALVEEALVLMAERPGIYVPGNLLAFSILGLAKAIDHPLVKLPLEPFEKLHERLLADGEGWRQAGDNLGRVTVPHWPVTDGYYENFKSDSASKIYLSELAGWLDA